MGGSGMKNYRDLATVYTGLITLSGLLFWPSAARAHLVTTGLGPVYDGIGHLLMSPEDLIPVVALALYAGLRGSEFGRQTLLLLPLSWLLGGIVGLTTANLSNLPIPAISFVMLGAIIAADLKLNRWLFSAVVLIVGMIHGMLNGTALAGSIGLPGLIGILAALFVIISLVSALVVSLKKWWAHIMVRVVGSWIAAVGILMIGWTMKGQ